MSTIEEPSAAATGPSAPFASLALMRAAHSELLQQRREAGIGAASTRSARRTDPPALELVAAARDFVRRGQATGALLDIEDERLAAQSLLTYWANAVQRLGHEIDEAFLDDFDPALAPELPDDACPYLGLDAFRESDSQRFYGRQDVVGGLVARLETERLLVLVGSSGSGKSSLMRAGLIPALRGGALPGSEGWRYPPPQVPGAEPMLALARVIHPDELRLQAAQTARQLLRNPESAPHMLNYPDAPPAVVQIDQFEEIFTLVETESERSAFVAALLALVDAPAPAHRVLITMRSDFEPFAAALPMLAERIVAARAPLTPLSAGELREAIEAPAQAVGLKFEPGVVDLLVQDIAGEPAGLPLLQFTLLKLWERRERNRITLAAYEQVGGGRQALARSADALYDGLIPEDQTTAKRIMLRMVRPGEGLEVTSSRARLDTLYTIGEDPARVERVVQKLIDARLVRLIPGDAQNPAQIEVAHEALVRNWPRLVSWLEDEKLAIVTRRRLEQYAQEWQRLGGGKSGLLDEAQLSEAERWVATPEAAYLGYDPAVTKLIVASGEALRAAEREREEARQRELAQAKALATEQQARANAEAARADAERRSRNVLRVLTVALAVLALMAIWLGLQANQEALRADAQAANARAAAATNESLAGTASAASARDAALRQTAQVAERAAEANAQQAEIQRQAALRQSELARAGQLAAQAQAAYAARPPSPQQSLLLAVEAVRVGDQPAAIAETVLREALLRAQGLGLGTQPAPIVAAAETPDGALLASADEAGGIWLWDPRAEPGAAVRAELPALGEPARLLALSADGGWLAVAGEERALAYRLSGGVAAGDPIELPAAGGRVTAIGISPGLPDGSQRWLVVARADGSLRGWPLGADSLGAPSLLSERERIQGSTDAIAFSNDGRWLLSGGSDRIVRLWDLGPTTNISRFRVRLEPENAAITTIATSPDSRWMAAGQQDGSIIMWGLDSNGFAGRAARKTGHQGAITALTFSPDSAWLLSGSDDRNGRIWARAGFATNGAEAVVLTGHTQAISSVGFSDDTALAVTGSADRELLVWDMANLAAEARQLRGHDGAITAVLAAGGQLLSAGADGQLRRWPFPPPADEQRQQELAALSVDELAAQACAVAGRELTADEIRTQLGAPPDPPTCAAR